MIVTIRRLAALAAPFCLWVAISCRGGDGVGPKPTPKPDRAPASLRAILGTGVADTIDAVVQPLVVEVRNAAGEPLDSVTVQFEVLGISGGFDPEVPIFVGGADAPRPGSTQLVTSTSATGRAAAGVRLGGKTTVAWIRFRVVTAPLIDSVSYVVRPGLPTRVSIAPRDTAVLLGATAQLAATVRDRRSNAVEAAATFAAGGPVVDVTAAGLVRGAAYGRAYVRATSGGLSDSIAVSVVPPARFVVLENREYSSDSMRVYLLNSDLTKRRLLPGPSSWEWSNRGPYWAPSGDRIVFQMGMHDPRLFFSDTIGNIARAIPYTVALGAEYWPQYSRDGQWVYFTGRPNHQNGELWRMRADGSGATRVGPAAGWYDEDLRPSPSPDGSKLVYWTNRTPTGLAILDIATGAVTPLGVRGYAPRWSPRGDLIAFIDAGTLKMMRPDGTGERVVGNPAGGYGVSVDWSPDGNWLVARGRAGLELIYLQTGEGIPLPSTARMDEASWKPVAP